MGRALTWRRQSVEAITVIAKLETCQLFMAALLGSLVIAPQSGTLASGNGPHAPGSWGAQPEGTFHNPALPAHYSDIDCIRVGDEYFAVSSTFQYSPCMVILRSKDLENWRIAGHAICDITQISPQLNWDNMNR
jgi:hypothetical protein